MQKQEKPRVTVVSDGCLFEGIRTPLAFVWVEVGVVPVRPAKAAPACPDYALEFLRNANLSKEDKAKCRREVSAMSAKDLHHLTTLLRGFRRSSARQ